MVNVQSNKIALRACLAALLFGAGLKMAVAAGNEATIAIKNFQIDGNNLLPEQEVQAVLAPFLGNQQHFTDVQKALEALEAYYRSKGYGEVLINLPEQELSNGTVRLQVLEPQVKSVNVEYANPVLQDYYPESQILASLPDLKAGQALRTRDISRNTQLANENPARQTEVVLRTTDTPGAVDAGVKVNGLPPRKAFATVDNTGTPSTGEYRMGFGIQHANLWGLDHVATFNYMTPIENPSHVNLFSGSYRIPLYQLGDSIDITAAKSDVGNSSTSTVAGPLQFSGSGDIYGLNYNLLLPRWGEYTHRIVAGYNYRAYGNSCGISGNPSTCGPTSHDITVMPISLTYSAQYNQQEQSFNFYFTGIHNIPGMSHGDQSDFNLVRTGAPADYTFFKAGFNYTALLGADWQMRLAGNAQISPNPLVYVEQFGLAGNALVRGFYEREATRDNGFVLNTELYSPNFAQFAGVSDNLRGLVFYDLGQGRNNVISGNPDSQGITLSSVGLGLRMGFNQSLQFKLDGAYVLDGATTHVSGDTRAHLGVYMPYSF